MRRLKHGRKIENVSLITRLAIAAIGTPASREVDAAGECNIPEIADAMLPGVIRQQAYIMTQTLLNR